MERTSTLQCKMVVKEAYVNPSVKMRHLCCDMTTVVFQQTYDTTDLKSISYAETHLTFSDSHKQHTDMKEEDDPSLITCTLSKTENEVSVWMLVLWEILFIKVSEFVL